MMHPISESYVVLFLSEWSLLSYLRHSIRYKYINITIMLTSPIVQAVANINLSTPITLPLCPLFNRTISFHRAPPPSESWTDNIRYLLIDNYPVVDDPLASIVQVEDRIHTCCDRELRHRGNDCTKYRSISQGENNNYRSQNEVEFLPIEYGNFSNESTNDNIDRWLSGLDKSGTLFTNTITSREYVENRYIDTFL